MSTQSHFFQKPSQPIDLKKQPYVRHQGNSTYQISIDESGKLQAVLLKDHSKIHCQEIRGIPPEWQSDLHTPERQFRILQALEHSYFKSNGGALEVNTRGLGGWTDEVHHHRTHEWCRDGMGFSEDEAQRIAKSCNEVDTGGTDPIMNAFSKGAQSWHFNKNLERKNKADGKPGDTRIQHAVENLNKAIEVKNSDGKVFHYHREGVDKGFNVTRNNLSPTEVHNAALFILGEGLHSLQDIFAHTRKFVNRTGSIHWHGFNLLTGTDVTTYINDKKNSPKSLDSHDKDKHGEHYSQRYTNTKLLTLFYLKCYRENRTLSAEELSKYVREALDITHYKKEKRDETQEKIRLQKFQETLGLFGHKDLATVNNTLEKAMEESRSPSSTLFRK